MAQSDIPSNLTPFLQISNRDQPDSILSTPSPFLRSNKYGFSHLNNMPPQISRSEHHQTNNNHQDPHGGNFQSENNITYNNVFSFRQDLGCNTEKDHNTNYGPNIYRDPSIDYVSCRNPDRSGDVRFDIRNFAETSKGYICWFIYQIQVI